MIFILSTVQNQLNPYLEQYYLSSIQLLLPKKSIILFPSPIIISPFVCGSPLSILDANKGAVCPMKKAKGFIGKVKNWLTFGLERHHCHGHLLAKAKLVMLANLLLSLDINKFHITRSEKDKRPTNFRHPTPYKIEPKKVS